MRKFAITILVMTSVFVCNGQSVDSLKVLIKNMQKGSTDSIRFAANEKFAAGFKNVLSQPNSFTMNFDSLKNVSVQEDDLNTFRIYTWVLPHYDGKVYDYFGFIQMHDSNTIISLIDSTSDIEKPGSEKLNSSRWYGSVYYDIITVEQSGKKYYTLLGWKGKNESQTEKVIDVLYFVKGNARFGYPLFKTGSVFHNRMVFSYNSHSTMTLHYNQKFGGIVFDHVSSDKNLTNISGPDGTYDAFRLKKGKWILFRDVDVRTKWNPAETLPEPPSEIK